MSDEEPPMDSAPPPEEIEAETKAPPAPAPPAPASSSPRRSASESRVSGGGGLAGLRSRKTMWENELFQLESNDIVRRHDSVPNLAAKPYNSGLLTNFYYSLSNRHYYSTNFDPANYHLQRRYPYGFINFKNTTDFMPFRRRTRDPWSHGVSFNYKENRFGVLSFGSLDQHYMTPYLWHRRYNTWRPFEAYSSHHSSYKSYTYSHPRKHYRNIFGF